MNGKVELLDRRRSLLRDKVKESRALEALLLEQDKQLEYERQRQITFDVEAELMEAESVFSHLVRPDSNGLAEFIAVPSKSATHSVFREGYREF